MKNGEVEDFDRLKQVLPVINLVIKKEDTNSSLRSKLRTVVNLLIKEATS